MKGTSKPVFFRRFVFFGVDRAFGLRASVFPRGFGPSDFGIFRAGRVQCLPRRSSQTAPTMIAPLTICW